MSKRMKITVITLAVVISLALSFGAGCTLASRAFPSAPAPASAPPLAGAPAPSNANQGADVVRQAWDTIFENYVDQTKLNSANLSAGAIKGIVEALNDPYTAYLSPQAYRLTSTDLHGKFNGIGATVGIRENKLTVIAPIPDSPAAKAGIKPGDAILEINGQSTAEMSLEEAVSRIRGPKGTSVKVLIQHLEANQPLELTIVRDEIKLTSVLFEMKGDVAYVRIFQFTEQTDEELIPSLNIINGNGAKGLIIDLRSNPGGLLDEVVAVASHFVKQGVVVSTVDNKGNKQVLSVKPGSVKTDLPMVVLTDNFSASASEVLSGALQDYGRATIAGTKTFGKGSVNQLFPLKDGSALFITIGRWLTPNGRLIEGKGLIPDQAIDLKGDDAINWALDFLKSKRQ